MSSSETDVLPKSDTQTCGAESHMHEASLSESCAKIKGIGFTVSKHIKMYGENFEIVSDPFSEGGGVAVQAISGNDPEIRTLRLPTTILVGSKDRFLKRPGLAEQSIS